MHNAPSMCCPGSSSHVGTVSVVHKRVVESAQHAQCSPRGHCAKVNNVVGAVANKGGAALLISGGAWLAPWFVHCAVCAWLTVSSVSDGVLGAALPLLRPPPLLRRWKCTFCKSKDVKLHVADYACTHVS